jgi:hypothetical protein
MSAGNSEEDITPMTTGATRFFRRTLGGGFRSGGQDYSFAQVADEIRGDGWAALNRDADVIAGPDRDQVARIAQSEPLPSADLAAALAR